VELKQPPHNIEVEQEVLSHILTDGNLMKHVIDELQPSDFYDERHKAIFKACAYLHYNHNKINYQNVYDRLEYYELGGKENLEYLMSLTEKKDDNEQFVDKVTRLKELAEKRGLYELGIFLTTKDIKGVTHENLVSRIEDVIDSIRITSNLEITKTKNYSDEWLKDFNQGRGDSLMFGFRLLDDIIMFEPSNLGILGARPSVGKSAYALNLVKNFSLQGKNVLFVSLEMSEKEVLNRLVANLSRVPHRKIQRKEDLSDTDKQKVEAAVEKIKELDIYIYDRGDMNCYHLLNLAKKLKRQKECDVVVVDYLQLMESGKKNLSAVQDVTYISRKLKQLAQDLDIPVLALSQLSRRSVSQGDKPKPPQLHDLRESGAIEQDANFVLMLHAEDEEGKFEKEKFLKMFVRKNRNGRLGKIDMTYYGDYVHFDEKTFNTKTNEWEPVVQEDLEVIRDQKEFLSDEDLPF